MTNDGKTHDITIMVSEETLRQIDRRAADRRPASRSAFMQEALEAYLKNRTRIETWRPDPVPRKAGSDEGGDAIA